MKRPTIFHTGTLLAAFFCFGLLPSRGHAQSGDECETDADCEDYRTCVVNTETACPDDMDTACEEGESDDECADRVDAAREEECETINMQECVPVWAIECESDAICGTGFHCADGPGRPKCAPIDPDCETDSDCLAGWLCSEKVDPGCLNGEEGCDPEPRLTCVAPTAGVATGSDESGSAPSSEAGAASSSCAVAGVGASSAFGGLLPVLIAVGLCLRRRRRAQN